MNSFADGIPVNDHEPRFGTVVKVRKWNLSESQAHAGPAVDASNGSPPASLVRKKGSMSAEPF